MNEETKVETLSQSDQDIAKVLEYRLREVADALYCLWSTVALSALVICLMLANPGKADPVLLFIIVTCVAIAMGIVKVGSWIFRLLKTLA